MKQIAHTSCNGRFVIYEAIGMRFEEWLHQWWPQKGMCRATIDTRKSINWDRRRGHQKTYRCVLSDKHIDGHMCPSVGFWFWDARKQGKEHWNDCGTRD